MELMNPEQKVPSFYWKKGTIPAELRTSSGRFLRERLRSFSITTIFTPAPPNPARMLSLWTGTWHLWKPLATTPTKGRDGSAGLLPEQNYCREAPTQFGMAASAGAARPLAGLWSEQVSVARMGWEESGGGGGP